MCHMFYILYIHILHAFVTRSSMWGRIKNRYLSIYQLKDDNTDSMLMSTTFLVWQRKHFPWVTRLRELSGSRRSVLGEKKADLVAADRNWSYRADTSFVQTRSWWVVVIAVFHIGWPIVRCRKIFSGFWWGRRRSLRSGNLIRRC